VKTLQNNGAVREDKYVVSENIKALGSEYALASNDLEIFSGNELQHYLHEQLITKFDQSFAIPFSEVQTLAVGAVKCAYAANVSHEYGLVDVSIAFASTLGYFAKRAGVGFLKGGVDFGRAVSYLLGGGRPPQDTSSLSEIFTKIKEQPLEGIGDGLEYAVRTLTLVVAATKFLEPFSVGVSPSGAATIGE
jgi:hypothetical protein